ncbi:MAG: DUF2442 domain-containing protein [Gammaproteobacteria bacterium]|nr:DUF2442 domain-containing protein [Gammaproteobacteria bacterium]
MTVRIIAAWPLERYQLWLAYADGTEGAVDLEQQLAPWSLEPLRDVREFRRLTLNRSQNLLVWPSGVDLDTSALYRELRLRKRRKRVGFL